MNTVVAILGEGIHQYSDLTHLATEIGISVLVFALAVVVGLAVYLLFKRHLTIWAERTRTKLDDMILRNIKAPILFFAVLLGAYFGLNLLTFTKPYSELLTAIFLVAEILVVALIMVRATNILASWYAQKSAERGERVSDHILFVLKKGIQVVVYLFAFLAILAVFKIDLSGIVVGLGVGGIAIALALQNVLGDVFSAFSIYFDRPFEVGDFIVIGDHMGTVKKIGIKSTRLQLLQGEELVISNRELTTAKVRNFRKLKKRRVFFTVRISCDTPLEKLKKIPHVIRKIIEEMDLVEFERVHFAEFGDFTLNFPVVYYMNTDDYGKYMDTQQEINFAIIEAFRKEGIEMPFPTQTIFLNRK